MLKDRKLQFCSGMAFGAAGTTYTDVIDLGTDRDIGIGREIEIDIRVTEAAAAASTDGTLTLVLQTATTENFASPIELARTIAMSEASLVVGFEPARWRIPSPTNRYLRIAVIAATQDFSAGKFDAAVVVDRQANRAYPSGYTVAA